jgi:Uma2 family endonuclease
MTPDVSAEALEALEAFYEAAEQQYLAALPPEHFMEATDHAHQRKITLESFDVIRVARPDIQCFNELLIQYPQKNKKNGQVVPDNFVVVHPKPIKAGGSFNTPLQPVKPLLVMEYVSKYNQRKDYEDNFVHYEKHLKVPYYLLFYPDGEEMTLFRMGEKKYLAVRPNAAKRCPIPELDLEVAILDKWVRYWFRGELVPLPADLVKARNDAQQQLDAERQARQAAEAELARLREELAKAKGKQ